MNREQLLVKQFHELIGAPIPLRPAMPSVERQDLRIKLIYEEWHEFQEACFADDLIEAADALGDLLVVVYGAGLEFGIDLEPVFAEIHRSNMTKGGGPVRGDGKALKGPHYEAPRLQGILQQQMARDEWDDYPENFGNTYLKMYWPEEYRNGLRYQRDPGDESRHG